MPDNPGDKIGAWFRAHKAAGWGLIAAGGVVGVILWRRRASQSATQQGSTATGDNIDPQTGFPYGSAEDEQALQQAQSGFSTGFGYDPWGGFNPFPVPPASGGGASTGSGGGNKGIQNNDQWLKAAENTLPNGHSSSVETALASVLGGLTVTWAQRALFLEAKGVLGDPPGGYPTPIKVQHSGGDHGGSHQKVRVPDVNGEHYVVAAGKIHAAGLKTHVTPQPHAGTAWTVAFTQPAGGSEVRKGSVVTIHVVATR